MLKELEELDSFPAWHIFGAKTVKISGLSGLSANRLFFLAIASFYRFSPTFFYATAVKSRLLYLMKQLNQEPS